ncbi:hypothetical protein [Neptunicella marina]|uniref:Uncharacterized protein n=1 Tax=Neptunicella marina TaxID=2125989 RepID=A0A8J6IRS3_9ALTE|nr:hypothetical protein [Neptunicella marina]MBC3764396.1 hypothetical protein [Neptunicella marina]
MNKSLLILWPLSIVAALWLGYQYEREPVSSVEFNQAVLQTSHQAGQSDTSINTSAMLPTSPGSQTITVTPITHQPTTEQKQLSPPDIASLIQQLADDKEDGTDYEAIANAYLVVKNLTAEQIQQALNQLTSSPDKNSAMLMNILLAKFAETNPYDAMNFVTANLQKPANIFSAQNSVIRSWAKNDPQGAYEWYKINAKTQQGNNFFRGAGLGAIFKGLAKNNLPDALQKLQDLSADRTQIGRAMNGIGSTLETREQFEQLLNQTKELNNQYMQQSAIRSWVTQSPQQATDWLALQVDGDLNRLRRVSLQTWVYSHPDDIEQAADWYMQQDASGNKNQKLDVVARTLAMNNPQSALEWAKHQSDVDNQQLYANILRNSAYRQPDFVMNNLSIITDSDQRRRISQNIYRNLNRMNPQKAQEFKNSSEFKQALEAMDERRERRQR